MYKLKGIIKRILCKLLGHKKRHPVLNRVWSIPQEKELLEKYKKLSWYCERCGGEFVSKILSCKQDFEKIKLK